MPAFLAIFVALRVISTLASVTSSRTRFDISRERSPNSSPSDRPSWRCCVSIIMGKLQVQCLFPTACSLLTSINGKTRRRSWCSRCWRIEEEVGSGGRSLLFLSRIRVLERDQADDQEQDAENAEQCAGRLLDKVRAFVGGAFERGLRADKQDFADAGDDPDDQELLHD